LRVRAALLPLLRGRLEVGSAKVEGARLHLVRDQAGAWNVARLLEKRRAGGRGGGAEPGISAAAGPSRLAVDRLDFEDASVSIEDRSVSPQLEIVLDPLDLEIDDLASGGEFDLALDTRFGSDQEARLRWQGAAGRPSSNGGPFLLRGQVTIDDLAPDLLARLGRLAGLDWSTLAERLESIDGTVEVDAALPERAALRGQLDFGKVRVGLPAAAEQQAAAIDLSSRFDLATERGADLVRIAKLEIDTGDAELALDGTVEREGPDARRVDLKLHPARVAADRLAAVLAVAMPQLPLSFSSPRPLEVEARIRGTVAPDRRPGIDGRVRLDDVRIAHRSMSLPIEHLSAEIRFSGESFEAKGFEAILGDSDLRGDLRVEGFARPRVRFDLASRRANLDQLFAALESDERETEGRAREAAGDGDLLGHVEAGGRLRVEQATWGELEGSGLDGTLRLEEGTVTLEPLTATLYDGRFDGKIVAWPGRAPLPFRIEGSASDVRVERFLAGALGIEDRLTGRFSGTISAGGSAGEWAEVARSLDGRGEMRIEDGEVVSFPLLRSVASLSGVLGEDGLAKIASRLAETATRFSVLAGDFRLGGGAIRFDSIELRSADYTLRGQGSIDLIGSALDGKAAMTFSAELSELMRAEDSRAAELFWREGSDSSGDASERAGHVNLPLSLRGALSEPSALIDWESAARSYAERRVGRELERQVGKILGRLLGGEPTPTPQPR
jgi:uncharacterized protein involved in outer membrane biogenesis